MEGTSLLVFLGHLYHSLFLAKAWPDPDLR